MQNIFYVLGSKSYLEDVMETVRVEDAAEQVEHEVVAEENTYATLGEPLETSEGYWEYIFDCTPPWRFIRYDDISGDC